jgi:chemotaxis protein methyltransferase CheR
VQLSRPTSTTAHTSHAQASKISGDTASDHPAYLAIRDLIYRSAGIYYSADKLYLLADRCQRRMHVLGTPGPEEYLALLSSGSASSTEPRALLNEITVGETYMFRNPSQLAALRDIILPQIKADQNYARTKHIRIWSAGCSTGEEPYTVAMVLLELSETQLQGWTFEVLASDINDTSLETARAGIYGEYALRNTAPAFRSKYFNRHDQNRLQVKNSVKSVVQFSRLNLNDLNSFYALNAMQVIFCCNVLIYFDLASKIRVIQSFYTKLLPQGYLFLGHAESLFQVDTRLRLVHFPKATAYRKVSELTKVGTL